MKRLLRKLVHVMAGMALILPATGYTVNFAQQPLSVGNAVEPNVMFILDDSGSMAWHFMPDTISNRWNADGTVCLESWFFGCLVYLYEGSKVDYRWYYSSRVNTVYYDPEINYVPPVNSDGTRFPNADFDSAYLDGYAQSGTRIDLNSEYTIRTGTGVPGTVRRFDGAFYYSFSGTDSCEENPTNNSCYSLVLMSGESNAQKQNFANWYSYYRTRMYASRAGIGEAFSELENNFRLGWGRINKGSASIDGSSNVPAIVSGVRGYDSSHKADFYNFLYNAPNVGGTPLRRALEGAGTYYETSAKAWADDPSENVNDVTNPERECRLAYTILMTDGFWNGDDPSSSVANADGGDGDLITGPGGKSYQYEAKDPFKDNHPNTLADVAMHYWKRDLRPALPNLVPQPTVTAVPVDDSLDETPFKSPAFWQHMVTYGVGLGVEPSIDPFEAFGSLRTGDEVGTDGWPEAKSDSIANIDDLLHAGVNSHGGFFSASDPATFAAELKKVLAEITKDPGSATSVDVSGETVEEGDLLFAASYDPSNWSGDLKAGRIGTGAGRIPDFDTITTTANGWSAAAQLDSDTFNPNTRTVITYVDGKSAPFRWDSLEADQTADLSSGGDAALGQARLNYIRGDKSQEGASAPSFRRRASRLGSIVNSSPTYVGAPVSGWPDSGVFGVEGDRYSSFVDDNQSRTPVVFAGANDGMLHGFRATLGANGGQELLAYIPGFLYSTDAYSGLHYLTDQNYGHRYYVDLATRKQDVYTKGRRANNGNATASRDWRTVLVGGARAGAKGIFALDVTDPGNFDEGDAPGLVLWEFSAADDARLGYITQPPVIALSTWGGEQRWTAFVANGYNSDVGSTGFFILDLEGGLDGVWTENTDYRYVEFENAGDGLSPLTVLDTTGDYMADRIYAGDLDGNIWVATNQSGNWAAAYAQPLFTADGPVTGAPAVASNKDMARATNEPNLMVYFGTGKYLETTDVTNVDTQAFYGVWDKGETNLDPDDLIERVLEEEQREVDGVTQDIRIAEGDPVNYTTHYGWFADLTDTGERVVNNPIVRGDYVYINTIIPSSDPCAGGGSGWIMGFGRMGGIVVDNAKAFLNYPADTQGYRTGGMPSQIAVRGDTLLYDESGENPNAEDLPPLGADVPGAGRRGWHELVE